MRTWAGMLVVGVALAVARRAVGGGRARGARDRGDGGTEGGARVVARVCHRRARHRSVGGAHRGADRARARQPPRASSSTRADTSSPATTSWMARRRIESRSSSPTGAGCRPTSSGATRPATWPSCGCACRRPICPPRASAIPTAREIGEWVLAVGSPLGLEQTITAGIISGRGPLEASEGIAAQVYLQTDAKVNPGNSGGPLVNLDGEVVGLAALISAGPGGSYGYAVPINLRSAHGRSADRGRAHAAPVHRGRAARHPRPRPRGSARWSRAARSLPPRGSLVTPRRARRAGRARRAAAGRRHHVDRQPRHPDRRRAGSPSSRRSEVGARVVVGVVRGGAALTLPLSVADRPAASKSPS